MEQLFSSNLRLFSFCLVILGIIVSVIWKVIIDAIAQKAVIQEWELPESFKQAYTTISTEFVRHAFEQSEKLLAERVRAGQQISEKAYRILGISVTVLTGSLIYLTGEGAKNEVLVLSSSYSCAIGVMSVLILIKPLKSYKTYFIGSLPNKLLREQLLKNVSDRAQNNNFFLMQFKDMQMRIQENEILNKNRIRNVDVAIYLLITIPFIFLTISLLSMFFPLQ